MRYFLGCMLFCHRPVFARLAFGALTSVKRTRRRSFGNTTRLLVYSTDDGTPSRVAGTSFSLDRDSTSITCFNHAGASPPPLAVQLRVQQHLDLEQQVGGYAAADRVQEELGQAYQRAASLIHARDPSEIALVESATVAWTRAFYSMAQKQLRREPSVDVILISEAEYAANVVAACQWARDHDWMVLSIPSSIANQDGKSTGIVDLKVLESLLGGSYRYNDESCGDAILDPARIGMVCITHVPTNSGIVNPVEEIGAQIATYNSKLQDKLDATRLPQILYLLDACQSIGQLVVDARKIQCHAMVATGRKYLRGPRGTGFLYMSGDVAGGLMPSHMDHYGVPIAQVPTEYQDGDAVQNCIQFAPRAGASRFEFWESNVASRLGLGQALQHALDTGPETIEVSCKELSASLTKELTTIPGLELHHGDRTTCGIVTFYSKRMDSLKIKEKLGAHGYELSVVPATSTPLDSSKTGVPDLVRVSVSYTNNISELNDFCGVLRTVLEG